MEPRWTAVSGTAHDDVWVSGARGDLRRFDGRAWVSRRLDERFTPQVLWAAEQGAVWVGGYARHARPALWHVREDRAEPSTCPEAPELAVTCLWGSSPSDLWAGALGGELFHGDGRAWTLVTKLGGPVRALAGCGPSDVFACVETPRDAQASEVWRWDGSAWRKDAELGAYTLRHALSLGEHGLWAIARPVAGGRATLASYRSDKGLRFVSTPFATDEGGPDAGALALCGREGARRAYVASSQEDLWCWDGEAWSRERLDTDTDLVGARCDARGERYFAGPYWVEGLWLDGAGAGFAVANRLCHSEWSTGEWFEGGVFRRQADGVWRPEVLGAE